MTHVEPTAIAPHPGRFVIATWDGGGNVPPALALGTRLARRGHGVSIAGSRSLDATVVAAGLDFVPYKRVADWPAGLPLDADMPALGASLDGGAMAHDIVDELARRRANVLVADCMSGAAMAAGAHAGIPMAILVHVLYQPMATAWGASARDLNGPRAALGLDPLPPLPFGDALAGLGRVLCLTPPGFDAPMAGVPGDTFYVGPVLPPDPPDVSWKPRDDRPVVLVSFSTTLMQQATALPPVLDALGLLPIEGVLTLGGVVDPLAIRAPSNVTVRDYVPHAAILPHAAAVVTHGGLSTVMASLAAGVPMVCIPQGRDQSLNAERVEATGVGIHLSAEAPPGAIAAAVSTVLADPSFRAAAAVAAANISALGRGSEAVRLTEELLQRAGSPGHRLEPSEQSD